MNSRAGFTLLDLMIGLSLFAVGLAAAMQAVVRTNGAYEASSARVLYEARVMAAVNRMLEVLAGARFEVDPVSLYGTDDVRFALPVAIDAVGVTFGPANRLWTRLDDAELDNGVDDDGDLLVDERELVLTLDVDGAARETVLLEGLRENGLFEVTDLIDNDGDGWIDEPGFALLLDGDLLHIQICGQAASLGESQAFDVPFETIVRMRN